MNSSLRTLKGLAAASVLMAGSLAMAQPAVNGLLDDSDYLSIARWTPGNDTGFGNWGLMELASYHDGTDLYVMVAGAPEDNFNGAYLYVGTGEAGGVDAGTQLPSSSGPFANALPTLDFDAHFGFRLGIGGNPGDVFVNAVDYRGGANSEEFLGQLDKAGTSSVVGAGTFSGTEMAVTHVGDLGAFSGEEGWELRIPLSVLGVSDPENQGIRLFAAYANGDGGFFSANTLPEIDGQAGTNLGNNPDFSAIAGSQNSKINPVGYPTLTRTINLNAQLDPSVGIHTGHLAIDDRVSSTTAIYLSSINNSLGGGGLTQASIPTIKISDPLNNPSITTIDSNDGGGAGVDQTRGSSVNVARDTGTVGVAWEGQGGNDSQRVRLYDDNGVLLREYDNSDFTDFDRPTGIALSPDGNDAAWTRLFNTGIQRLTFADVSTSGTIARFVPITADAGDGQNPRDVDYDPNTGKLYVNAGGNLLAYTPAAGGDITQQNAYSANGGGTVEVLDTVGNNSNSAHGVGVSADGSLVGFTPSPNAGEGANTARITTPEGTLAYLVGQLDQKGDGTNELLGRATDIAFFRTTDRLAFAVADTDNALTVGDRSWNRIAIYEVAPLPASIEANPLSHDFGSVTVGDDAVTTFTISNTGDVDLEISSIDLTGDPEFSLDPVPTTPLLIGGSASEDIFVRFAPASASSFTADLDISHNDNSTTSPITLTVEGISASNVEDWMELVD